MFGGDPIPEDVATAIAEWSEQNPLWAIVGPSTAFGREVLGRLAASLGAGLVGDAIALDIVDGELVAAKPAFSGAMVADITCTSQVRMVSVRPGVLPLLPQEAHAPDVASWTITPRSRVRLVSRHRDDDVEILARADVVIGLGAGVQPGEYEELATLAALLGAELAATRKVTDNGWAPRSRQVGITGRSISPRLYVALGLSGKFNHMVGVRARGDGRGHQPGSRCSGVRPVRRRHRWRLACRCSGSRLGVTRSGEVEVPGSGLIPGTKSRESTSVRPTGLVPPMSPARNVRRGPATPPRGHPWVTHLLGCAAQGSTKCAADHCERPARTQLNRGSLWE